MNFRNYAQVSFNYSKNFKKKTFVINKLQKQSIIPNLDKKTNILFQDPDSYLKMPYETDFRFVIGRKPKGPRFNSNNKLIPYTVVGSLMKKEQQKKLTRIKTLVTSNSSQKSVRKSMRMSKAKFNPIAINEVTPKEDKKKKKTYRVNLTDTEIFDIFNKSKKRISKNKSENLVNEKKLYKEIPKVMHQYINEPLSQQERALKNNEKYNDILKKLENNISKSLKNKMRNKKFYNDSKCFDGNIYNSSSLLKNSGTEYRSKVEKINSNDRKKNPHLILPNPVQNWEMSLRRPTNFIGERREYLNVRTDSNPFWIILTEKNPFEDEKILIPKINNMKTEINFKNTSNINYFKNSIKQANLTNNNISPSKYLEIKGQKLIDIEEKLANQLKGNIKMIDLKYDRESLKDIKFRENYFINKHSFSQK